MLHRFAGPITLPTPAPCARRLRGRRTLSCAAICSRAASCSRGATRASCRPACRLSRSAHCTDKSGTLSLAGMSSIVIRSAASSLRWTTPALTSRRCSCAKPTRLTTADIEMALWIGTAPMRLPDSSKLMRTASFVIVNGRDVFLSRPGNSARAAWENAADVAGLPKKDFVSSGWKCRRIWVTA